MILLLLWLKVGYPLQDFATLPLKGHGLPGFDGPGDRLGGFQGIERVCRVNARQSVFDYGVNEVTHFGDHRVELPGHRVERDALDDRAINIVGPQVILTTGSAS